MQIRIVRSKDKGGIAMVTKRSARMTKKRERLRKKFWPKVTNNDLWLRKNTKGFGTIPRGLSIIMGIMNSLTKGKPVSSTYITLWCYVFDEMTITIQRPRQMAMESGFTGQRAENTWRDRMKKLEELGFIKSKAGASGDFHYVLLLNPYLVVKSLEENKAYDIPENLYNTLIDRIDEIGEKSEI